MQRFHPIGAMVLFLCPGLTSFLQAEKTATGFQAEMRVEQPTRLNWEFVLSSLGGEAPREPAAYDSTRQRYQLFVPPAYDPTHSWPLVVFLAPGDDPLGWRHWQKTCEQGQLLFCAAYGAGARTGVSTRTRIVLDMLDDVRRRYRIDPEQTYLTGFSSGGSLAGSLAFALPETCAGVIAVCGGAEINRLDYLRIRMRERLSLALVTGSGDFNRREVEDYQQNYFTELGVRAKTWSVRDLGHAMPGPEVLSEAVAWLAEDLPRRRTEARRWADPGAPAEELPAERTQARRMLEMAEPELNQGQTIFHGVALLEGILARYKRTDVAETAEKRLREIQADARRRKWLEDARALEEKRIVTARARALERSGDLRGALQAWGNLATTHLGTPEGIQAAREMGRLKTLLDATPYLGLNLEGESATVQRVIPLGPAEQAGLREGDRLLKLGPTSIATLADLRQSLQTLKPGDRVAVIVQRGDEKKTLNLEIGKPPG
jgi:predicted esterase